MTYRRTLWSHCPLTDFWRVGRGYADKLQKYGLYTMGDIARCSVEKDKLYNEDLLYRNSLGNIGFYPLAQHDQILATCPDGFILTVNYDDAEDYIERAINYLNSIVYGEVIAIYLFGYKIDRLSFIQHKEPVNIEKDLLSAKARSLAEKFGIPVFFDNQYSELIETIENFFQE